MRLLLALSILTISLSVYAQPQPLDATEQNKRLGRGVNIIGYDPLWYSRADARFQEKHFRLLKEAGFQSVRVNLHAFAHMDREKDWALHARWFETLDWVVERATNPEGCIAAERSGASKYTPS